MNDRTQIIEHRDGGVRCFVDTEFYEDGSTIDLISIGAVRSDGLEFYLVNSEAKLHRVSPWVREHVLPKLPTYGDQAWQPRSKIASAFAHFINGRCGNFEKRPLATEIWSYYADYDWVAIAQLYGTMMELPEHFPKYCLDLKQFSMMIGDPVHPKQVKGEHNALDDARYHSELYEFLRRTRAPSGDCTLRLDEGERQALLLALAHLAIERPGWDDMLNRMAVRIDNVREGRAVMFDEFRALDTGRPYAAREAETKITPPEKEDET